TAFPTSTRPVPDTRKQTETAPPDQTPVTPTLSVKDEVKMLIETYRKVTEEARTRFVVWLNETCPADNGKDGDRQKRLAEIEAELGLLGPYKDMSLEQRKRANQVQQEKDRLLYPKLSEPGPDANTAAA